jgi:hypothetical protein
VDRSCSIHGEKRNVYNILVGKPKGRDQSEDRGLDGRTILKSIWRKWCEGVDWIHLAQNRDRL